MSRKRPIDETAKPDSQIRESFRWPPSWWCSRDGATVVSAELDSENDSAVAHKGVAKAEIWNALSTARRFLPSGVPAIDAMLSGGLPSGMVVEISGAAGCGKSQFAMTLTAQVLLPMITVYVEGRSRQRKQGDSKRNDGVPSMTYQTATQLLSVPTSVSELSRVLEDCTAAEVSSGGGKAATAFAVYYINTEGRFPHRRLKQITRSVVKRHLQQLLTTVLGVDAEQEQPAGTAAALDAHAEGWSDLLMNFVFVELVNSDQGLWEILNHKLATLSRSFEVEMIVIDSIAALFRVMAGDVPQDDSASFLEGPAHKTNFAVRAVHLFRVSALLRRVAADTDCWIVCNNQVSSDFSSDPSAPTCARVKPALGLSWSNCVNCRLMLSRSTEVQHSTTVGGHTQLSAGRSVEVQFAPHVPRGSASFYIDEGGLAAAAST